MQKIKLREDVLDFLLCRIESVPHLEALLLFRDNPDVVWVEEEISTRLHVDNDYASLILLDLARHDFIVAALEMSDGYRYDRTWDQTQIMSAVSDAYRRNVGYIAGLIHTKAASDAVRAFADAFEFKKKE
ncbi:MAG: hypothetical protein V4603_14460 [Pseudomonadota bacterium]